jgi:hypothetical protein
LSAIAVISTYVKRLIILLLVPLFFLSAADTPQLDEKNTNAIIKSSYVYNFCKLISWPQSKNNGNFIIGVLGDPGLYKQLISKYSNKLIGNQPIEIIQLLGTEQMPNLHVLFVSRSMVTNMPAISNKTQKAHTLVIAEHPDGIKNGATLNFVVIDNQLKFEVGETNASDYGLTIGITLKSLAYKVVK